MRSAAPGAGAGWLGQRERGSALLLRLVVWLARRLGRPATLPLLRLISLYFWLTAPAARRASRDFLGRALGRRATAREVRRHVHAFALTIHDRVYLLSGGHAGFGVAVDDPDGLGERLAGGQGCILVGAHLGSFEVLRTLAVGENAFRLKVLMREGHNPMLTRLLARLNPAVAATVMTWRGPEDALRLKEHLDGGHMIGMLGDRLVEGERGVAVDFLGAPAPFPAGPVQLAAALKAPLYLFLGLCEGDRRYRARFELLAERVELPRAGREAALRGYVARYAERLGAHARAHPFEWFNFYPFWPP
ncbi:MAG: hypothetical protein KDG89_05900 [Geminicoccaceae bacterium]|nr:hypothetical protein [Geminicoccaceae bacterium]